MIYSIQNASIWKRLSAWLLDFIVLVILATGFAFLTSLITNFDHHDEELQAAIAPYEEEYGFKYDMSTAEYEQLSEEDQQRCQEMFEELRKDQNVNYYYNLVINLIMVITSVAIFLASMVTEFVVPLFLKNGQTLGKKVFAIGVVKINAVKITNLQLFVRSFLGKTAIELMVPTLLLVLIGVGHGSPLIVILLFGLAVFQLLLFIINRHHQAIHDVLAYTVVVDMQTQMIFDSEEELLEYKKKNHSEEVKNKL